MKAFMAQPQLWDLLVALFWTCIRSLPGVRKELSSYLLPVSSLDFRSIRFQSQSLLLSALTSPPVKPCSLSSNGWTRQGLFSGAVTWSRPQLSCLEQNSDSHNADFLYMWELGEKSCCTGWMSSPHELRSFSALEQLTRILCITLPHWKIQSNWAVGSFTYF